MKFALPLFAPLAVALAATTANAATIDFQDVSSGTCAYGGYTIQSRGFNVSGNFDGDGIYICEPGVVGNNTTAAIVDANGLSEVTIETIGGGTFSLQSFHAGARSESFNTSVVDPFQGSTGLMVEGFLSGGGSVSQMFSFNGTAFEQFVLPGTFTNLLFARFTALGTTPAPEFVLDDITVNEQGAVPEPATWAMMLVGFGALGGAMRRRPRAVHFAKA